MAALLQKPLKRELIVEREPYNLTISPSGFVLLPKGKRKGVEIPWSAVVNGDAALATSLNASLMLSAESAMRKPSARKSGRSTREAPAKKSNKRAA